MNKCFAFILAHKDGSEFRWQSIYSQKIKRKTILNDLGQHQGKTYIDIGFF